MSDAQSRLDAYWAATEAPAQDFAFLLALEERIARRRMLRDLAMQLAGGAALVAAAIATWPALITVGMYKTRAYPDWFLPINARLSDGNTVDRVRTVLPGWLAPAAGTACVPELPHAKLTLFSVSSERLQVTVRSAVDTATPTGVGCSSMMMF